MRSTKLEPDFTWFVEPLRMKSVVVGWRRLQGEGLLEDHRGTRPCVERVDSVSAQRRRRFQGTVGASPRHVSVARVAEPAADAGRHVLGRFDTEVRHRRRVTIEESAAKRGENNIFSVVIKFSLLIYHCV